MLPSGPEINTDSDADGILRKCYEKARNVGDGKIYTLVPEWLPHPVQYYDGKYYPIPWEEDEQNWCDGLREEYGVSIPLNGAQEAPPDVLLESVFKRVPLP